MQVIAVKPGAVFSSPSGIAETRGTYTVPVMETAVRAVNNYEAKKTFMRLVPALFISSKHIPETWCHPRRVTGHGTGLNGNPPPPPPLGFYCDSVLAEIFNVNGYPIVLIYKRKCKL